MNVLIGCLISSLLALAVVSKLYISSKEDVAEITERMQALQAQLSVCQMGANRAKEREDAVNETLVVLEKEKEEMSSQFDSIRSQLKAKRCPTTQKENTNAQEQIDDVAADLLRVGRLLDKASCIANGNSNCSAPETPISPVQGDPSR